MSNMSTIYLDRIEASKILKVSTRTLDRYIRRYKIKIKKEGRVVLIPRNDVDKIINDHIGRFLEDFNRLKTDGQPVQNVQDVQNQEAANLVVKDIKVENVKTKEEKAEAIKEKDEGVYQHLYLETKKELKERQDRLEAATYRVGQLEAQLKNMIPLLEYNKKDKELKEAQIALENRVAENQVTLQQMDVKLRSERVAKWVYLSLTGLLLIVEPVLFLIWAFN